MDNNFGQPSFYNTHKFYHPPSTLNLDPNDSRNAVLTALSPAKYTNTGTNSPNTYQSTGQNSSHNLPNNHPLKSHN